MKKEMEKNKAIVVRLTVYIMKDEWRFVESIRRKYEATWRQILLKGAEAIEKENQ